MQASISVPRRFMVLMSLAIAFLSVTGILVWMDSASEPALAAPASAQTNDITLSEKVIVVNVTATINIIDTATDIVHGPYLSGTLGSPSGGTFDVAVTPDGKTALISNFGDSAIYIIDVSEPLAPTFVYSVTTPMFAEDIDISADGRFALVTDGGFSRNIVTLDLLSPSVVITTTLPNRYSNAVEVAPNNTVVTADYFQGAIHALILEPEGSLTYTHSYSYTITPQGVANPTSTLAGSPISTPKLAISIDSTNAVYTSTIMSPVNVAIAPDGQTVLVCNVVPYWSDDSSALFHMGVYRITAPGELTFSKVITGMQRAVQSIAFSPDGRFAYLSGNGMVSDDGNDNNQIDILEILSPGEVSLLASNAANYPRLTSSQLFGVDTIVEANGKLYVGNPTLSGGEPIVRIVDLENFNVIGRDVNGIPTGVGVIPINRLYLPVIGK